MSFNWTAEELQYYDEAEKRRNDYESALLQKFDEGEYLKNYSDSV